MRTPSERRWYIYLVLGLIDQNCSSGNVTSLSISNTVAEVHNGSARTLTANFPVLVFKRLRCPDDAVQQTRPNVGYSSDFTSLDLEASHYTFAYMVRLSFVMDFHQVVFQIAAILLVLHAI